MPGPTPAPRSGPPGRPAGGRWVYPGGTRPPGLIPAARHTSTAGVNPAARRRIVMAVSYQQQALVRKVVYTGLIVALFTVSLLHRRLVVEPQANNLQLREV